MRAANKSFVCRVRDAQTVNVHAEYTTFAHKTSFECSETPDVLSAELNGTEDIMKAKEPSQLPKAISLERGEAVHTTDPDRDRALMSKSMKETMALNYYASF